MLSGTAVSAAISLRSWCAWTVSSALALFYAIVQLLAHGSGWALVVSTVVAFVFVLITLALVIKFRRGPAQSDQSAS